MASIGRVVAKVPLKEADGSDAGGSGGEAGVGVFRGDASERKDRDWGGSRARQVQKIETAALRDTRFVEAGGSKIGNDFFKDRAKKDEGRRESVGVGDFVQGVAGDAHHRFWQSGRGVEPADVARA